MYQNTSKCTNKSQNASKSTGRIHREEPRRGGPEEPLSRGGATGPPLGDTRSWRMLVDLEYNACRPAIDLPQGSPWPPPRWPPLLLGVSLVIRYRLLPIFRTFLGDFTPDRLDSRSLQTLWEWKNRVLLEEYYIFNVAIPLEVE